MEQSETPTTGLRLTRMDALCDGVFAIAMTLLVLELHIPLKQLVHSNHDLFFQIKALGPKFLSYFLSFLILGIFWVGHNSQFAFIKQIDRELLWINILFLLFISLIPFSTAMLGEYMTYPLAIWIYWMNLLFIGLALLLNWVYARNNRFIPILNVRPEIHRIVKRRILLAQLFYFAGALSSFISIYLSMLFFLGIQISYVFTSVFDKQTHKLFKK